MKSLKAVQLCLGIILAMSSVGCMKGEQGPPGPAGGGNRVISTLNCNGTVQQASSLNGLYVEYSAVLLASGDVYSTASISDEYAQYSGTSFYAAGQNGAQNASVLITFDAYGTANSGYWNISLDRNTLITTAVYTDSNLALNSTEITFDPSACSVRDW